MPTGYTANVGDGKVTEFRTFALQCARNFGACIMQRDDPMDNEPKLVEPSNYHQEAIKTVRAELTRLQGMTVEQAGREADAEWIAYVQRHEEYQQKQRITEDRYRSMIRHVEKWTPPTPEHAEMKRFMLAQLHESIRFDCSRYAETAKHLSGEAWLTEKRGMAAHDIGYHTVEHTQELKRAADRNAWITALYNSLEPLP